MTDVIDRIVMPRGHTPRADEEGRELDAIPVGSIVAYGRGRVISHFAERVAGGFKSKLGAGPIMFHATLGQITH